MFFVVTEMKYKSNQNEMPASTASRTETVLFQEEPDSFGFD